MSISPADWAGAVSFLRSIGSQSAALNSPVFQESAGQYLALLLQKNEDVNLTGAKDLQTAFWKHLVDSLALLSMGELGNTVDWGSGGGLPGIPLALERKFSGSRAKVHFVDSVGKKVRAVEEFAVALGLQNACGHIGRGEVLLKAGAFGPVDTVVMRAVAPAERAIAWVSPLAKQWILFLGPSQAVEWRGYESRLQKLKMKISEEKSFALPRDLGDRCLLRISKSST